MRSSACFPLISLVAAAIAPAWAETSGSFDDDEPVPKSAPAPQQGPASRSNPPPQKTPASPNLARLPSQEPRAVLKSNTPSPGPALRLLCKTNYRIKLFWENGTVQEKDAGDVDLTVEVNQFAPSLDVQGICQDGSPEAFDKPFISESRITASKEREKGSRTTVHTFVLNRVSGGLKLMSDRAGFFRTIARSGHIWTGPYAMASEREF